ncbi:MAG: DUF4292 domain-containing protein [Nitrospirota bacterium]|nr:DUF4292 domain-containing protein [Nitrospirota bacterium]
MNPGFRITAHIVPLLFAAGLFSSCALVPSMDAARDASKVPAEAQPLFKALKERESFLVALRAIAYVTIDSMAGRQSTSVTVILQSPRYMRLEFISPAGFSTASFVSDGKTYQYIDLDKQQFMEGKLTSDTLKDRLGLVLEYDLLWQAMAGQIPFPLANFRKVEIDGKVLHALAEAKPGYETRNVYSLESNLPLEHIESDESGVDLTLLRFDNYARINNYALPKSILFANAFAKVSVKYNDVIVNDAVGGDAFFLTPTWDTR